MEVSNDIIIFKAQKEEAVVVDMKHRKKKEASDNSNCCISSNCEENVFKYPVNKICCKNEMTT